MKAPSPKSDAGAKGKSSGLRRHPAKPIALGFALLATSLALSACEPADKSHSNDRSAQTQTSDAPSSSPSPSSIPLGHGFDFYVLSLSWSPSYCASQGSQANRQQCSQNLGFVVHGLWPQYERSFPENCRSADPARVPERLVQQNLDLLPSAGLIGHQWRKHGTCTGLSQADYFTVMRQAAKRIIIPAELSGSDGKIAPAKIEQAMIAANRGLGANDMAVTCNDGYIQEMRICLTRDTLAFRACPEIDRKGCRTPADMPERF